MRAALYIRVSTEEQSLNGLSLAAQEEALTAYASQNNYNVAGVYRDAGVSGRKPVAKRPALLRLLKDVENKKIDIVLFTKLDRWFRNVSQYYAAQDVLDKHKVPWTAVQEDYETQTASGRLKVNIMLAVAQDEADRTSERIRAINQSERSKGLITNGKCPLGFKVVDKRLHIDEETAPLAQECFRVFLETGSVSALKRHMLSAHGLDKSYHFFNALLRNKKYIGQLYDNQNACEPLINKKDFDLVQSILSSRQPRTTSTRRVYLFSGLVRCGKCGSRMSGKSFPAKTPLYYGCPQKPYGKCTMLLVREDKIEAYLLEHVLGAVTEYNAELTAIQQEKSPAVDRAAILRKIERTKDLYVDGVIDRDELNRRVSNLTAALEPEEEEPKPEPIDLPSFRSVLDLYGTLEKSEKKEFWSRVISAIAVSPSGDISFTLRKL